MVSNEGRMKALIEIAEKAVEELKQRSADIVISNMQIRQAASEVDELRGIVGDLKELLEQNQRTTWVTTTELAAYLKIDEKTARRWMNSGRIRGYRLSDTPQGNLRFDLNEINEDIRRNGKR